MTWGPFIAPKKERDALRTALADFERFARLLAHNPEANGELTEGLRAAMARLDDARKNLVEAVRQEALKTNPGADKQAWPPWTVRR